MVNFPMRFYVASSLENAAEARRVGDAIEAIGHRRTYDWTVHGSVQDRPDVQVGVAVEETAGVCAADFVVVLLPGGRGTHVELGVALGTRRPVFLVGADEPAELARGLCVFYCHPSVRRFAGVEDLLAHVATIKRGDSR